MGAYDNMNPLLASRIQALIAAGRAAGFNISPGSGYRSYQQQARLYQDYINGVPGQARAAPPGRSNHNHGLAMDLRYGSDDAIAWAHANAGRFGLRFPMDDENWHIELAGGDDEAGGYMQAAQQHGAVGYDLNWMATPTDPEAQQDQYVAMLMGAITSSQRDALLGTMKVPELDTPTAGALETPALAQDFDPQAVGQQIRTETMTMPGAPGAAPQGQASGPAGSGDQLSNARIIAQVGRSMGASDQQIKIALAAALVESNLKNVNYGDRDSLGLFQQRPSQGWGSPSQVMNPQYAATQFFSRLLKLDPGRYGSPGLMAQAVQRSAYPGRYDERWGQANTIFGQLGGG